MVFAISLGRALGIAGSRWVHLLAGITWIGLLYYFNFIQTPSFATFEAGPRTEAVRKLVPRALWWFRMAAALTFITGILILGFQDQVHGDYFKTFSGMSIFAGALIASPQNNIEKNRAARPPTSARTAEKERCVIQAGSAFSSRSSLP